MRFNPDIHKRRSARLPGYDYAREGAYFVTICVRERACLFGEIRNGEMALNDLGRIVQTCWMDLAQRYEHILLDEFVIMPNHLHGIICIHPPVGAQFIAPLDMQSDVSDVGAINCAPTIGNVVRAFKAKSSYLIRKSGFCFSWQRNYHDRIIRDESELHRVREYVTNNPLQWDQDAENPANACIKPESPRSPDQTHRAKSD